MPALPSAIKYQGRPSLPSTTHKITAVIDDVAHAGCRVRSRPHLGQRDCHLRPQAVLAYLGQRLIEHMAARSTNAHSRQWSDARTGCRPFADDLAEERDDLVGAQPAQRHGLGDGLLAHHSAAEEDAAKLEIALLRHRFADGWAGFRWLSVRVNWSEQQQRAAQDANLQQTAPCNFGIVHSSHGDPSLLFNERRQVYLTGTNNKYSKRAVRVGKSTFTNRGKE